MKKPFSIIALLAITTGTLFFTSCSKDDDDTTPPVITLTGGTSIDVVLNSATTWTEAGYTANDNEDGNLTSQVQITGTVNMQAIGTYTLTYKVTDAAGNYSEATRTVNVIVNDATYAPFSYAVVDVITGPGAGTYQYNVAATISAQVAGKIWLANFGGYGSTQSAYFNYEKNGTITLPEQHLTGAAGFEGVLTGTGTTSPDGNTLSISYSYVYDDGSGTDTGTATYTKR